MPPNELSHPVIERNLATSGLSQPEETIANVAFPPQENRPANRFGEPNRQPGVQSTSGSLAATQQLNRFRRRQTASRTFGTKVCLEE
jgi:hypothetical protein